MSHTSPDPLLGWLSLTNPGNADMDPFYRLAPTILAPLLLGGGWGDYIATNVKPQLDWGCKRFVLWMPFGDDGQNKYRFDQPLNVADWLKVGFVDAWRAFIKATGVEVIYYQGGITRSPSLQDPATRLKRIQDAAWFPLRAGMSIGLDADAEAPDGSLAAVFAQYWQATGTRVYVEARPRNNVWSRTFPVISVNQTWIVSDPDTHPDQKTAGMISNSQLTGEVIRYPTHPEGTPWNPVKPWAFDPVPGILKDGYSVAIDVRTAIENKLTRAQVLGQ